MTLCPQVSDWTINEMFTAADTDGDGQLSFAEFSVMVTPPAPPEIPRFTL